MKKKIDWVTAAAVLAFIVVGVAIYLIADYHGPGIVSKWVKQLSRPADEVQDEQPLILPEERLVVNPNFDGTNDEYIFVEAVDDESAVTEIRKITKYRYYSDNGDAIAETTIRAYDSEGKVLSANSSREQVKNPDTSVARIESFYTYRYSDEKISCTMTVTSYLADGTVVSTDVQESERLR